MSTQTLDHHDSHHNAASTDLFGFWLYIMSDCLLFASIFAVYAVLHTNTFGGPGMKELTSLPYVLVETAALLFSSFTYGMAILSMYKQRRAHVNIWLVITFILGAVFIAMELNEFIHLYMEGHDWQASAALSAFFTLVGTHGAHVSIGLLWMIIMLIQVGKFGLTPAVVKRLTLLGLFWAFLDIVWIFVYTVVYLMGVI